MIIIRRCIAGLNLTVEAPPTRAIKQLEKELTVYPPFSGKTDILIRFRHQKDNKALSNNPTIHNEYEDGFAANFGLVVVRWRWGHTQTLVDCSLPTPEKNWLKKTSNIQFTHPYEQIGQIFFELVLIPTLQLFYYDRFLLLHGSALALSVGKEAVVFGGTGGVGKTSLELALVGNEYLFMADDITFVDRKGTIWANFSWPKIYGYNTLGDDSIKSRMFSRRGIIDRLCWYLRMWLLGESRVRRRVDPKKFYNGDIAQQARLSDYYILYRDNTPTLTITPLETATAIDMSLEVMISEYSVLYRHLYWHKYNRAGLKQSPCITIEDIFGRWQHIGHSILDNIRCYLVHVPFHATASDLKSQFLTVCSPYKNDPTEDE